MSLEGTALSVSSLRLVSGGACQLITLTLSATLVYPAASFYGHRRFYALYPGKTHSRISATLHLGTRFTEPQAAELARAG